jgi:hypothetical protein
MTGRPECTLQPMHPIPTTSIESVCSLQGYSYWLHRLHRLQNRPNAPRPCLPEPLFRVCCLACSITPGNVNPHREARHAV